MKSQEEYAQMRWDAGIDRIVRHLDQMKEKAEQLRHPRVRPLGNPTNTPDYYGAAQELTHSLIWDFANMSIDGLYHNAGDAVELYGMEDKS